VDRISAATEIRSALYGGDLFLEYQPVISLEDNRCVGAEALLRWRRKSHVVLPMEFIPLIENTPLSGLVTYWVIDTVAQELAAWMRATDGIHIAINVPPEVFGRGALEYAGAKARVLDIAYKFVLEITERGVPDKLGVEALNARPRDSVLIALDDVCTSETSLLVLSQVRVDILKIDKSCIDEMIPANWSPEKMSVLRDFMRAARGAVIAEGVETRAQLEILRDAGIAMAQGWYFSQSLSALDFMAYFYAHR
jgi:sensor c-di-GMP phosphodiesterase-like protein